jgi:hypothetical protein
MRCSGMTENVRTKIIEALKDSLLQQIGFACSTAGEELFIDGSDGWLTVNLRQLANAVLEEGIG